MVDRRNVISGGVLAGVGGLLASPAPAVAAAQSDDGTQIAQALDRLRAFFERQADACELGPCRSVDAIRAQQRTFIRANEKYPDFIEVGLNVWDELYDWHIKQRQPVTIARLADGRYGMSFMFTTVILRADQQLDFVGFAFDADPRR